MPPAPSRPPEAPPVPASCPSPAPASLLQFSTRSADAASPTRCGVDDYPFHLVLDAPRSGLRARRCRVRSDEPGVLGAVRCECRMSFGLRARVTVKRNEVSTKSKCPWRPGGAGGLCYI
ncbi:hypothetical protein EVAR_13599_1 [Eumeta japonica]|uniref:Uncharacterized protein n=1 Tax=Eumeta variegata TaxID=151549 RepID=A0A4C1UUL5_EUMVA|nr:hypothetical protein EVAR_13599_1 [Eumeta japonica]